MSLSSLSFMRPVPGYADYRTPIRGLYLCGAATHPGRRGHGRLRVQRRARDPAGHAPPGKVLRLDTSMPRSTICTVSAGPRPAARPRRASGSSSSFRTAP